MKINIEAPSWVALLITAYVIGIFLHPILRRYREDQIIRRRHEADSAVLRGAKRRGDFH